MGYPEDIGLPERVGARSLHIRGNINETKTGWEYVFFTPAGLLYGQAPTAREALQKASARILTHPKLAETLADKEIIKEVVP